MHIRLSHLFSCLIIALLLYSVQKTAIAQQSNKTYLIDDIVINTLDRIDTSNFPSGVIEEIIIDKINTILNKRGKEPIKRHEILSLAANDQAKYMANIDNTSTIQMFREKATTALRVQLYGGSMCATEITEKNNTAKGKIPYTYNKVCNDVVLKLFNNSKKTQLIQNYEFNLIGIGAKLNKSKKKVYISFVLGNYKSNNKGAEFKHKLTIPYTEKYYGLTAPHPKYCRKVNKATNLFELQKNLSVEDGIIYYETDNAKKTKRVIRNKKDGIAVDIIQKEQFLCANENIIDYNNLNRGVLTKKVNSNKLFRKNIANIEDNKYALKTRLGYLPEGIKEGYELNLILIQNKSICKSIPQSFLIKTSGTYSSKVELLADTVIINTQFCYTPEVDSMTLSFRIPFENKKFTYKTEDIDPFLKSLNEPAFIINDLKIKAFSSIEGTDKENKFLQEARAKRIVDALKEKQQEDIATEINSDYNWEDFKIDIKNTKHSKLASMNILEAQDYIRKHNLKKELEPLLQKHRYAEIKMKVTSDIKGENEQPFVLKEFSDAINEWNRPLALSIQKFIIQQILKNKYDISVLHEMIIPEGETYAGMRMNKLYVLNRYNQVPTEEFVERVNELHKLDPDNEYIAFNQLLNTITYASFNYLITENSITQSKIDRLYYTPLSKETVDGLNIKYQFKLIAAADSSLSHPKIKSASIDKIKEIVDIKEESMSNALKLAEIFIENNDYAFAHESLAPWVTKTSNEKLLLTFISLCSLNEWLMHSQNFNVAMNRLREIDRTRFCELFNGDGFSLRVFENSEIKEEYCKSCNEIKSMVVSDGK